MKPTTFNAIRQIVYRHSGISLGECKEALVSARVAKRLRALGLPDAEAYLAHLADDTTGQELVHLLDVISTNVTSFFRESAHFDFLRDRLLEWYDAGQRRFRIWSAACSTGEEPYSMAIAAEEALGGRPVDLKILATDISTDVLRHGEAGEYAEQRVQTVPPVARGRYFDKIRQNGATHYRVKESLRERVVFCRINLSQPPFTMRGPFDIVFCRNVMIYFDNGVRRRLLEDVHRLLKPGGYLAVGHTESLTGTDTPLKTVGPSVYVKG